MVESLKLFSSNLSLKFEILAGEMAKRAVLFWQSKSVNKGVCRKLVLRYKRHRDRIMKLLKASPIFDYLGSVFVLDDHWIDRGGIVDTSLEKSVQHSCINGYN